MKRADNNAICNIQCEICHKVVKCRYYTSEFGEDRFIYQHDCIASFTIDELKKLESIESIKNEQNPGT